MTCYDIINDDVILLKIEMIDAAVTYKRLLSKLLEGAAIVSPCHLW